MIAQAPEGESDAATESEAEAGDPPGPEIDWRACAEAFVQRLALRLVLLIGWQHRLPNEAPQMIAAYLVG